MIPRGSIVIVHLSNPTEKFWGVLEGLELVGVTLRGIGRASCRERVWIPV